VKQIIISGNLGKDSRFTANENTKKSHLKFSVACQDWDSKTKTKVTDWVDCIIFGDRASAGQTMLLKGCSVIVSGRLQKPEIWTDKDGKPRCSSTIMVDSWEFAGAKKDATDSYRESAPVQPEPAKKADEDCPF
jgi:single-strand DNA-binding protein